MTEIKVSKIELQIGKKKFDLSVEEAKRLKKILCDTFPNENTQWIPYYSYPIYPNYPYYDVQTTWTSGTISVSDGVSVTLSG